MNSVTPQRLGAGLLAICFAGLQASGQAPTKQDILHEITLEVRAKWGYTYIVPGSLGPSQLPGFYAVAVSAWDRPDRKRALQFTVNKKGTEAFYGRIVPLAQLPRLHDLGLGLGAALQAAARMAWRLPSNEGNTIASTTPTNSPYPGIMGGDVYCVHGCKRSDQYYIMDDHRFIGIGHMYALLSDDQREALITIGNDPMTGPPLGPGSDVIVEFSDFECPACARLSPVIESLARAGKVTVVYKDVPLPFHRWAMPAARAARCVYRLAPGQYTKFRQQLFSSQRYITAASFQASIAMFAANDGIKPAALQHCSAGNAINKEIAANKKEARGLQLSGLPTLFINGMEVSGLWNVKQLENFVHESHRPDSRYMIYRGADCPVCKPL